VNSFFSVCFILLRQTLMTFLFATVQVSRNNVVGLVLSSLDSLSNALHEKNQNWPLISYSSLEVKQFTAVCNEVSFRCHLISILYPPMLKQLKHQAFPLCSAVQHVTTDFKWPARACKICEICVKSEVSKDTMWLNTWQCQHKSSSKDVLNLFKVFNIQFSSHNAVNIFQ